jgi:glutathione S-transferase
MGGTIVHGVAGSPYVQAVRLALEEKQAEYSFAAMPSGASKEPAHLARQPFGRVPAFEHDGFALYETQAIVRYVDETFAGPSLVPTGARQRARMNQILGIVDWYVFPSWAVKIAVQRLFVPRSGGTPDEAVIESALPEAATCLRELDRFLDENGGLYLAVRRRRSRTWWSARSTRTSP